MVNINHQTSLFTNSSKINDEGQEIGIGCRGKICTCKTISSSVYAYKRGNLVVYRPGFQKIPGGERGFKISARGKWVRVRATQSHWHRFYCVCVCSIIKIEQKKKKGAECRDAFRSVRPYFTWIFGRYPAGSAHQLEKHGVGSPNTWLAYRTNGRAALKIFGRDPLIRSAFSTPSLPGILHQGGWVSLVSEIELFFFYSILTRLVFP